MNEAVPQQELEQNAPSKAAIQKEVHLMHLFAKAQRGEPGVYEEWLREIAHISEGYVRSHLPDPDVREELVRKILVTVHKARHTYDGERPMLPWLSALIRYRFSEYMEKEYQQPFWKRWIIASNLP